MNKNGGKHMTLKDRTMIETMLTMGLKLKDISIAIDKDERTISKEIQKRMTRENNGKYNTWGKGDIEPCITNCRYPYVCNGCKRRSYCFKKYKYFYNAKIAQEAYEAILSDSRKGLDITTDDKAILDETLQDGIKKGQSINHIVNTNKDKIKYSVTSVYRLVNKGDTSVNPIDLRRAVKLKPRKHYEYKQDCKEIRIGRTYNDFLKAISNESFPLIVEMDTVESVRSGKHKCFLTLHITNIHFMIVFLLDSKTKEEVSKVFVHLQKTLGVKLYKKLFQYLLTDRGTEFSDPITIEYDNSTGEQIAHLYFCNSYSSYQKGAIEENHTLLRYIVPKGVIFDHLSLDDVVKINSHINSYYRESIDSSPYQLAVSFFGVDFVKKLGIQYIQSKDIILNTKLIK